MSPVEFIVFLFAVAALVWVAALLRFSPSIEAKPIRIIPALTMAIVISGSVLGAEFFSLEAGPIPITIDRLLFCGVVALCGWFYLTNREDLQPFNRLDLGMIAMMGILTFSTLTHDHTYRENLPLSQLLFFNLIPFGVYFIARTAKTFPDDLRMYRFGFVLFAIYLAITAVLELKGVYGLVFPKFIIDTTQTEFLGRGRGPFLNPVSNGVFQVFGLCCLWFWWPKATTRMRVLIVVASLLLTIGVYATLTRSVWMSVVLVGFLIVFLPAPQHFKGAMVVAGVVAMIFAGPTLLEKAGGFKRDKDVNVSQMKESAQLRPLFLTVAMRMFQDRPIFGCGYGQYFREKTPYLQDPYTGKPLSKTKGYVQHNVFLAYLTELGLVGLLSLIVVLGMMVRVAWRIWSRTDSELIARQFGMLMGALLAVYVANGMFHDVSISPMLNMLLFFTAGVANNIQCNPQRFKAAAEMADSAEAIVERPTTTAPNSQFEPHTVPVTS